MSNKRSTTQPMIKHIGRLKLHDSQGQEWLPVLWSVSLFSCVPAVCSAGQDGVGPLADAVARDAPALRRWVGRASSSMLRMARSNCNNISKQAGHFIQYCCPSRNLRATKAHDLSFQSIDQTYVRLCLPGKCDPPALALVEAPLGHAGGEEVQLSVQAADRRGAGTAGEARQVEAELGRHAF